jgi:hypothetical protein
MYVIVFGKTVQVDALRLNLPTGEAMQGKDKERFLTAIEPEIGIENL